MNGILTESSKPPRHLGLAISFFLPHDRRTEMLADMDEEFHNLSQSKGQRAAHRWYMTQVFRSVLPLMGRWVRLHVYSAAVELGIPSVGGIYFAIALLWFGAVAVTVPFDAPPALSPGSSEAPVHGVTLQDGSALLVYWVGEPALAEYFEMPGLMRFSIIALAPPAIAAVMMMLILSLTEAGNEKRRLSPNP